MNPADEFVVWWNSSEHKKFPIVRTNGEKGMPEILIAVSKRWQLGLFIGFQPQKQPQTRTKKALNSQGYAVEWVDDIEAAKRIAATYMRQISALRGGP